MWLANFRRSFGAKNVRQKPNAKINSKLRNTKMSIERCHRCVGNQACGNQVVNACLPVPFFGDITKPQLKVVTVGLNPAHNEYFINGLSKDSSLRLALLTDYKRDSRTDLSDADVADAKDRREKYFQNPSRDWHPYFEKMENVLNRVNPAWTYMMGSAVHIDVVACATQERWGKLNKENPSALKEIISNCREHFSRAISNLPDGTIILCDGPRALAELASIGFRFDMQPSRPFNIMGDIGRIGELDCGTKKFSVRDWSCQVNFLTAFWRFDLAMWIQGTFAF
jgi:hypothetical protein